MNYMSVVSVVRTDILIENNLFKIRSKNYLSYSQIFETFPSKAHHFYKNNLFNKSVRTTETTLI